MSLFSNHKFHLVRRSQLPFLAAGFSMLLIMSVVYYLHPTEVIKWDNFVFHTSIITLNYIILGWFLIIVFESGKGFHTLIVQKGLKFGFWLFIVSEAMLFFSFFWSYFHYKLNPSVSIANTWPPFLESSIEKISENFIAINDIFFLTKKISIVDPYIPLLNTILLLSSGYTVTIAHRCILNKDFIWNLLQQKYFFYYLLATIMLGYIFLICQLLEYTYGLPFSWISNVYWSIFFILTGFHGAHVIIGTLFLNFNLVRFLFTRVIKLYPQTIKIFNYVLTNLIKTIESIVITFHIIIIIHLKLFLNYLNKVLKNPTLTKVEFNKKAEKLVEHLGKNLRKKFSDNIKIFLIKSNNDKIDFSRYSITTEQHLGFESALYYWHFVDAVWILLYIIVYLWRN